MEIVAIAAAIVVILIAVSVLAVFLLFNEKKQPQCGLWYVELWNICHGYVVQLQFSGHTIVGRTSLLYYASGPVPTVPDVTVSSEHCMIFDQGGTLLIHNMSAVNPAVLNGRRLDFPTELKPGDRLEMGKSVFLITRVVSEEP